MTISVRENFGGLQPDNADVLNETEIRILTALGFMAARSGQLVPCLRIFEALSLLRPIKAFPYIGLTVGYLAVGMASAAVELLRDKAVLFCKNDPDIHLYLALAFYQSGQPASAIRLLDSWADFSSTDPENNPLYRRLYELIENSPRSDSPPVPASVIGLD